MNSSILSTPAPDDGYNAILGALAPQNAPAEGTLGGTNPSVHNKVKQTFVNPVASYPFIARKWSEHFEVSFHPGDLIFIFTGESAQKSHKSVILANLPTLNHILRSATLDPNGKYGSFADPDKWQYVGVMRNSSAAANESSFDNGSQRGGNAIAADRIINVDVRGATRVFNYWEDARSGDHVWLAWRQVAIDTPYTTNGSQTAYINPIDSMKLNDTVSTLQKTQKLYWQLLPFSGDKRDYCKIQWNNQVIASPTVKHPICAGWVFQSIGAGEVSRSHLAIRKATQLGEQRFMLPVINVFVHV